MRIVFAVDQSGAEESGEDARDLDDRHCPACGTLMKPVGMPSGEIVSVCPNCHQVAI